MNVNDQWKDSSADDNKYRLKVSLGKNKQASSQAEEDDTVELERREAYIEPLTRILLRKILESGEDEEVTPVYQPGLGFVYELSNVDGQDNSAVISKNFLDNLVRLDILEKTFFESVSECPYCGSTTITIHNKCPKCKSHNVDKTSLTEHIPCGNIDQKNMYIDNCCPKCGELLVEGQYRHMGRSGLKLSAISLGGWITFGGQIDDKSASDIVHRAYELGVNFFDNADVYSGGRAELTLGSAIKDLPRQALVLSSKVFWRTFEGANGRGLSRKHIMESCEASLKRIGVDYLDVYFCHRYDNETPLDEVVRAMDDLIRQGKVLYWGTSEWRAAQIANAYRVADQSGSYRPAVEQPHYNLLVRRKFEDELAPAADDLGFGLVTWSPLRSGLLSGKYDKQRPKGARLSLDEYDWLSGILTDENLEKARGVSRIADELGVSSAQLAIAWILRMPQVSSVISGATSVDQLVENLGALELVGRLDEQVLERLETVLGNKPLPED